MSCFRGGDSSLALVIPLDGEVSSWDGGWSHWQCIEHVRVENMSSQASKHLLGVQHVHAEQLLEEAHRNSQAVTNLLGVLAVHVRALPQTDAWLRA